MELHTPYRSGPIALPWPAREGSLHQKKKREEVRAMGEAQSGPVWGSGPSCMQVGKGAAHLEGKKPGQGEGGSFL